MWGPSFCRTNSIPKSQLLARACLELIYPYLVNGRVGNDIWMAGEEKNQSRAPPLCVREGSNKRTFKSSPIPDKNSCNRLTGMLLDTR